MNRRQLLGGVLAGTTAALSGCGALESSGPEVVLDHVTVRNLDDSDHVIDVEVLRDGERFARKMVSVMGKREGVASQDTLAVIVDDVGGEPAEYVVRTKFGQDQQWADATVRNRLQTACVAVEVRIAETGNIEIWNGYLSDSDC